MTDTPPPNRLIEISLEVAREAAQGLLAGYRSRPTVTEKAAADLVTEFDLTSEALIRNRLERATPGIAIVAEEQGGRASGLTWYCDPLDGTMNFVHGHPFFCVSIGAMDGTRLVAGAVVAPALGVEWWGAPGFGAFRAGKPCRVSETPTLRDALLATGFPANRSKCPRITCARSRRCRRTREGSAGTARPHSIAASSPTEPSTATGNGACTRGTSSRGAPLPSRRERNSPR